MIGLLVILGAIFFSYKALAKKIEESDRKQDSRANIVEQKSEDGFDKIMREINSHAPAVKKSAKKNVKRLADYLNKKAQ